MLLIQVFSHLKPGLDLSVNGLPIYARYQMAAVLDRRHPRSRDWSALSASLNLEVDEDEEEYDDDEEEGYEEGYENDGYYDGRYYDEYFYDDDDYDDEEETTESCLDSLLSDWADEADATIRNLHEELVKLGRPDAVETLLSVIPLFRYQ